MLGFETTDDERLLKDSVERFVQRDYPLAERVETARTPMGYSAEHWKNFAQLGWLGLSLPQAAGGFGGGARETAIVMEAFGEGLVTEPYLANVVMAGSAVSAAAADEQSEQILSPMASGERKLGLAYAERHSRYDVHCVNTTARTDGSDYVLDGEKSVVLNGDSADAFVVSARSAGAASDEQGISLFLVEATQPGVSVRGYPTNDGGRAAEVTLSGVRVSASALLGKEGQGYPALQEAIDRTTAAVCAEALGIMKVLNETTLEYSKTRKQFGQPIGSFQAVQHRLVDTFVALEESRSLLQVYMADVDSEDADVRARAVSAMKVQIGKAGQLVGEESIQLHGGIAMTDEYIAGHYFKRLTVILRMFGDIDWHLDRLARLADEADAA